MTNDLPREMRAQYAAQQATAWLRGVVEALRQVHGQYAGVGGRPSEIDWYIRAKTLVVNDLHHCLTNDLRHGMGAMLRTLAEFAPAPWIEEEYGEETYRLICGKVDRLRGELIATLLKGAPLPHPCAVA